MPSGRVSESQSARSSVSQCPKRRPCGRWARAPALCWAGGLSPAQALSIFVTSKSQHVGQATRRNLRGLPSSSTATCSIVEFGVVREYLQDMGQECMGSSVASRRHSRMTCSRRPSIARSGRAVNLCCQGNMSLGISQDLRFKLEYYGSNQHGFNEVEIEGSADAM